MASREGAFFLEGAKTIVGTSNRFRVVTDVGYDDFMQWERPMGVARVPSLAAPLPVIEQRNLSPVTQVAKSYAKIPKSENLLLKKSSRLAAR